MEPGYPGILALSSSKNYPLSFAINGLNVFVEESSGLTTVTVFQINLDGDLSPNPISFLRQWARNIDPYVVKPTYGVLYNNDIASCEKRFDVIVAGRTLEDRLSALKDSVLALGVLDERALQDILKDKNVDLESLAADVGKTVKIENAHRDYILNEKLEILFARAVGTPPAADDDTGASPR